jgi:cellulose synthase/poly-beta-1,6-N-acetylglucosamine synthase-like glycosyltransferase
VQVIIKAIMGMLLYLFVILVLLIFIRWIFIFITAFFQFIDRKKQKQRLFALLKQKGWPPISIVIPAYNEEKMISAVIEAILATDYPVYEIIIVNDASSDNTLQIIKQYENKFEKVHVISNNINKGKALSLNVGIQSAKHEVIIAIDADTILMKKTLKYLVLPLLCEEISATASNLKIGNNHFLLALQYSQ